MKSISRLATCYNYGTKGAGELLGAEETSGDFDGPRLDLGLGSSAST